ncbi:hypothetical protein [Actinocorallia lasiicapitis]
MAILLGGALTGVLAVCAIAGLFILKNASSENPAAPSGAQSVVPKASKPRATVANPTFTPFEVVPNACAMLKGDFTQRLVPGGKPAPPVAIADDLESKCAWGDYGDDPRILTVDLRGFDGATSIAQAKTRYLAEWQDDRTGKSAGQREKLRFSAELPGLGENAYTLYYTGDGQGAGVVNARVGNVLITVRYAGRTDGESALPKDKAVDGARAATEIIVAQIRAAAQ